jgi:hypothetical protein
MGQSVLFPDNDVHHRELAFERADVGYSTFDQVVPKTMNRLLMFIGMTIGGYVGWWAGDYLGFGLMGTFLVSSLGSAVGIFVAWKVLTDYLS